jgi:broad specificity phosphatase PhoE
VQRLQRILAVCLLATLAAWSVPTPTLHGASAAQLTTILLVRHAERGPDEGIESPITGKGRERAQELARVCKDAGITQILVSEFIRTRQTAEPLAAELKIQPETVPVQKGIQALAKRIGELHGKTILVVSHGGRIEPLIEQLGGGKIPQLQSGEYDNLFVLTLSESGAAKLLTLKYGTH